MTADLTAGRGSGLPMIRDQRRPNKQPRWGNSAVLVRIPMQRIITSSICRRIRMGIAGLEAVGCRINLRSYMRGRRRERRLAARPSWEVGRQLHSKSVMAGFLREFVPLSGRNVYRKSTENTALG